MGVKGLSKDPCLFTLYHVLLTSVINVIYILGATVFWQIYNPYLRQSYLSPIKSSSFRSSLVQSSPVHSSPLQSTPIYFTSVQTLQSTAVLIFTIQSCLGPFQSSPIQNIPPPTQLNTRADFHYQYNSHKDSKAWRRKGPTPHWVFSSLRFRRMRGGWERVS